ncbi:MAG TPA: hypothetical protein VMG41_06025 [Gemmatimonadales bacterium]|nr:hypothetical protein [Gemmatimonadales bacterium]
MKRLLTFTVLLAALAAPLAAQGHARPPRAPNPPRAPARRGTTARPEPERRPDGTVDRTPHVRNNHWYGHAAPDDARFRLLHPFEHGRFPGVGPMHHYRIARLDRDLHRFWLPGGFYFQIADWDWPFVTTWCWDCGDEFVIYDDPDHPGWYIVYDIQTGMYVHAMYMGT